MNFSGDHKHNVFVPNYAPQFAAMRDAGGIPGVGLENANRSGVWVPLEWLQASQSVKQARWQPLSAEALRAMYPSERK